MSGSSKKLFIAFYWHMHQPVYKLNQNGDYLMPWVRLHAVKDYLDMVLWAKKNKNIKLNFNFSPVLLDSIVDYAENDAFDIHSRLSITDADALTKEDKIFILNNFFDANYQTMILPNLRYHELYKKNQLNSLNNTEIFSNSEYSDIMALFNLVWIDSSFINSNKDLKELVKKGKNYTTEDRIKIIEIQRVIIKKIIPTIKSLIRKNKIELTTSPYYHPILPILENDYDNKNRANFDMEQDAKKQTIMALDRVEQIFGVRPRGVWPSEHCISEKTLKMLADIGVDWSISDEKILSQSINFEFEHDFKGYLKEPYNLLKTYLHNSNVNLIFRDTTIHNLINFEYPNHNQEAVANDLYDRIKVIQSKILSSFDEEHLLTIALDGENCWENYINDGNEFLKTLYNLIANDETLETVLISDYLDCVSEHKKLEKISSGSWFNKSFKLWIDEPVKNMAWEYLNNVRNDFELFSRREPDNQNLQYAQNEIFICEGSDWFWWYGEPNDSGRDNVFDFIFRTHLKNVYRYLDLDIPKYLDEPIENIQKNTASLSPKSLIKPDLTGLDSEQSEIQWENAGCIEIPDGPILKESKLFEKIKFGNDNENFYLRFYPNKYIKNNSDMSKRTYQMYIYTRKNKKSQTLSPVRLISKTENVSPLAFEKFHNEIQIAVNNETFQYVRIVKSIPGDMWVLSPNSKMIESVYKDVMDIKIPFELLDIKRGEIMEFVFINASFGIKDFYIPNEILLKIKRPASILEQIK